ncbi:hypothetical protein P280DRAFT_86611 [Massarina eburnea CBS 473.64]|uniref:F1F0 ATP synthase assembly protein Atp10 n=1 Tax=Massarina eburnea CBS 473.64 TaxID=1395130 RepID=A0A6A6RTF2_9PLEO|nr:hypothetical protein P280DRAFT_86611 [Massarina eburnea CBS 473.64]
MLQPRIASPMARIFLNPTSACLRCQTRAILRPQNRIPTRAFTTAPLLRLPATPSQPPRPNPQKPTDDETFVPRPLGRPIGFQEPPQPGQNTGREKVAKKNYSGMTMSERNLAKRVDLVEKWGTNYFRDFKNIRKYRSGKTFMANARIFKKEAAMYFPNFHGDTLVEKDADTTNVLKGRVSVVNVYSSEWGASQVQTFTSKDANAGLHEVLAKYPDAAQMVDINIEENLLKGWIISLFQWSLRLKKRKEDWGRYFVVKRGVGERIRETIGLLNGRVGYVYLVDEDCKIRWAGSANAEGTEAEDLTKGFARLIDEATTGATKTRIQPQTKNTNEGAGAAKEKAMPIPVPVAFK